MFTQRHFAKRVLGLLAASLLISSCSGKRPAQWPDGVEEDIFEIGQLESARLVVSTGEARSLNGLAILGRGLTEEMTPKRVTEVSGEERLKSLFKDLDVFASNAGALNVQLDVGVRYLTASKVVTAAELAKLPLVEQAIAQSRGDSFLVPLFQYPISAHGTVERTKNDLGEETRTLQIVETEPEQATHVRLSTLVSKREVVTIAPGGVEDARQIFATNEIDGRLLGGADLANRFAIFVDESEAATGGLKLAGRAPLYRLKLNEAGLAIFQVADRSTLPEDLKLALERSLKEGKAAAEVQLCDARTLSEVAYLGLTAETCVVALRYTTNAVEFVKAERGAEDHKGSLSSFVSFSTLKPGSGQGTLVRIAKGPALRPIGVSLDPRQTLNVEQVKGREFLMRRTLQDSPNLFDYAFAGLSGALEIVEFRFEENQVRVIRAQPLMSLPGNTPSDLETLMLLPARYVKVVDRDEQGQRLPIAQTVAARATDAGAIALVDWTSNRIPNTNSPLEYYQLERCFAGRSEHIVSDIDSRLEKSGLLSFTLASTYAGNVGAFDCAGIESAGYFDTVQKTFTFRERVSFRAYEKAAEEKPLLSVPLEAQKQLGFGLFTYRKLQPGPLGQVGREGTEIPLAAIFDLRKGQKIRYALAGLPQGQDARSREIREAITQASREVVADLNAGLRKALAGTPLARNDDIVELVTSGDVGTLGDLDRNHIYFVEKATSSGVLGLGGSHHNPRTGKVESASVYLYGGNMLGYVDSLRRMAKAQKNYAAATKVTIRGVVSASENNEAAGSTPSLPELGGQGVGGANGAQASALDGIGASVSRRNFRSSDLARTQGGAGRLDARDLRDVLARRGLGNSAAAQTLATLVGDDLHRAASRAEIVHRGHLHARGAAVEVAKSTFLERLRAADVCVLDKGTQLSAAIEGVSGEIIEKESDVQLLARIWKSTLLHEIGHNFGLRHNFAGSYDKARWTFAGEETTRNYSSIMDYMTDDHFTYDGFGPQDVAALRAAYGGHLELANGKLVGLEQYRQALGLSSWLDLTKAQMSRLPLKAYRYCTDEDAGGRPGCDRFDSGSNPVELVRNAVRDYHASYALTNLPADRLRFSTASDGAYIGRLFSVFVPIRLVLDETLYQAFGLGDETDLQPWIEASVEALQFFHDVVRTPDLPAGTSPSRRFVSIERDVPETNEAGEPTGRVIKAVVPVERRALKSLAMGQDLTRMAVRGVEYDKVIALIMLTSRGLGVQRYEEASLRFSFADFEKLLLRDSPALTFPTIDLLHSLLSVDLAPRIETELGRLALPTVFDADISEMMQIYALLGGVVNLESQGLQASDNLASHFRILSDRAEVKDLPFMTSPGSQHDLKFFAFNEASVGFEMIKLGHQLGMIRTIDAKTSADLEKFVAIQVGLETGDADALKVKLNEAYAGLPADQGPRTAEELTSLTIQIVNHALGLVEAGLSPEQVGLETSRFARLVRGAPTAQLAINAATELLGKVLPEDAAGAAQSVLPGMGVSIREATMLKSAETMSGILYQLHPELWR